MNSAFEAPTTEQTTATETPTTEDWVKNVVAEKGEQWSDPQVLAKGYANAQQHIKELEARVAGYAEQDYAKELLAKLQTQQAESSATQEFVEPAQSAPEQEDSTKGLSPEDVQSLLEKTLSIREKTTMVETALREKFGDTANVVVHKRSQELGLSMDRMKEIAAESPQAFLSMIGEPATPENNSTSKSTVNSQAGAFQSSGNRNHEFYRDLRQKDKKRYLSAEVQQQMIQDRMHLGDKFYT